MNCEFPNVKGTTGYRYGCRCDRCKIGMKRRNKTKRKGRRAPRLINLPSLHPDLVRNSERPTATAFGGC